MSKYRELDLLREQEHTLMQLHMNFSDQLNRLRVEELALTNLLRLQKEREMQAKTGTSDPNTQIGPAEEAIEQETMEVLNLVVSDNPVTKEEVEEENEEEEAEEEEEEDEEESNIHSYNDQLTTFLEDLLSQQKEQNQQGLQLAPHREEEEEEDDEET